MVPGSASLGMVAPTRRRTVAIASGPSSATAATGPEVMNSTRPVVEVLAGMHRVVALRHLPWNGQQPQADDLQALPLEARHDLADEPALDAVGLDQDEGAFHGPAAPLRVGGKSRESGPARAARS